MLRCLENLCIISQFSIKCLYQWFPNLFYPPTNGDDDDDDADDDDDDGFDLYHYYFCYELFVKLQYIWIYIYKMKMYKFNNKIK